MGTTPIRNVGIVAHVDAGKTTITEHMLFNSGQIRSLGRVDQGTAHTDWLEVERERGISVSAAATVFSWRNGSVNLIDTPGHVDFSSEVERSLRVLDGAVLVVSAAEGVQAHTETLWQALQSLRLPSIIFVNKMDRIGAEPDKVLAEIKRLLTPDAVPIQLPIGIEQDFTGTLDMWSEGTNESPQWQQVWDELRDCIAERDEELFERYVQGEAIASSEWKDAFIRLARQARIIPVLFGSAIRGIGVEALLDAVLDYLPEPGGDPGQPLSGVVFKLERSKTMGRLAYVRLYNGTVRNREVVQNATRGLAEKVTQIRKMEAQSYKDVGKLQAGDIGVLCGLGNVKIGDILGSPAAVPPEHRLSVPLLTVQVKPASADQYPSLVAALQELAEEDPLLDLQWLQEERELHVKVMGTVQLEILSSVLLSRFGIEAMFSEPSVIYKETPTAAAEGYVAYTMPKPCWAILRFKIEPGPRGSGLIYGTTVRHEHLLERYQNEVARRVPEALQQGLYGWEVTDLRITLVEGEHHVWHTHPLDFVVATPMGIMDGLTNTGTTLLEPMLHFRISVQEDLGGRILGDLTQMRAEFDNPAVLSGRFIVEGILPVATSLDYAVKLGMITGGRGTLTTRFAGYQECPRELGAVRPRRGIDPRDRSKYILAARNALQ